MEKIYIDDFVIVSLTYCYKSKLLTLVYNEFLNSEEKRFDFFDVAIVNSSEAIFNYDILEFSNMSTVLNQKGLIDVEILFHKDVFTNSPFVILNFECTKISKSNNGGSVPPLPKEEKSPK